MSEPMGALAAALAKAQGEMKNAAFNRKNPHFKSNYADLAGIRDTVTPILAKHGLAVVQAVDVLETGASVLRTTLMHEGGGSINAAYPLPANHGEPQKFGSALTYARRYSLAAICNIASEEDDDGNAASEPNKAQTRPPAQTPQTATDHEPPPRALSQAEAAVKWVQDSIGKLAKFKTLAEIDEWEAKNWNAIDKLQDNHRDTWAIFKRKLNEARAKVTPAMEAAE